MPARRSRNDLEGWAAIAALLIVGFLIGMWFGEARAHAPAPDWIMDHGYQTSETIPPSRNTFDGNGRNCCGPKDCKPIAVTDYRILPGGDAAVTFRGHSFTVGRDSVHQSEDGLAWFCAGYREAADPVDVWPYCLFIAPSFTRRD